MKAYQNLYITGSLAVEGPTTLRSDDTATSNITASIANGELIVNAEGLENETTTQFTVNASGGAVVQIVTNRAQTTDQTAVEIAPELFALTLTNVTGSTSSSIRANTAGTIRIGGERVFVDNAIITGSFLGTSSYADNFKVSSSLIVGGEQYVTNNQVRWVPTHSLQGPGLSIQVFSSASGTPEWTEIGYFAE